MFAHSKVVAPTSVRVVAPKQVASGSPRKVIKRTVPKVSTTLKTTTVAKVSLTWCGVWLGRGRLVVVDVLAFLARHLVFSLYFVRHCTRFGRLLLCVAFGSRF